MAKIFSTDNAVLDINQINPFHINVPFLYTLKMP